MENLISKGTSSFLVKDKDLASHEDSTLIQFLEQEGFKNWKIKGFFGTVDWIFINLNTKTYAPGVPGIQIAEPIGNHAITKDEFLVIYNIYKKYNDLEPSEMNK